MPNYKINPTYYRVTWNQTSPNNYSGLTGTQAGGLDSSDGFKYNSRISVTGTVSVTGTPLSDGDTLIINGNTIAFASGDTLADIIERINMYSLLTKVIAHNSVSSTYVTLTNSLNHEGEPVTLTEGTGALGLLGLPEGVFKAFPCVVGGAFTTFTNNDTILINGTTVKFTTAGGLDQAGTVATINSLTSSTGVIATRAANKVQLSSVFGQPITTGNGTADPSKLGFPAGVYGGTPSTLAESTSKMLATLRWQQVINQIQMFSTPFVVNDQLGTGNYDGSAELTTFSFTVGYEHPDQVATIELPGEPNPGNELKGSAAVKRAVARGLTASYTGNTKLFDPTTEIRNQIAIRPNSARIVTLTADGLDTLANIGDIESNISVTIIAYE